MSELKYKPVVHDHKAFLAKARTRKGFSEAYDALALEYQVAGQMLKARSRAGLTQDAVAERMGTTKSAVSRLESAGKHAPSLATLRRYASAVGCELQVRLVRRKTTRRSIIGVDALLFTKFSFNIYSRFRIAIFGHGLLIPSTLPMEGRRVSAKSSTNLSSILSTKLSTNLR